MRFKTSPEQAAAIQELADKRGTSKFDVLCKLIEGATGVPAPPAHRQIVGSTGFAEYNAKRTAAKQARLARLQKRSK